jgi:hypothetical protein
MRNETDLSNSPGPEASRDPEGAERGPGSYLTVWFVIAAIVVFGGAGLYFWLT